MEIKSWGMLTLDEQNLYLTLLWEDGYSEKAIAHFFSTTKGRIVRRRQSVLKLTTEGRPPTKKEVNADRFRDLLDLHAMAEFEEQGVAVIMPLHKAEAPQTCAWPLASSTQEKPVFCDKEAVEGHRLCEEHLAIALRSR